MVKNQDVVEVDEKREMITFGVLKQIMNAWIDELYYKLKNNPNRDTFETPSVLVHKINGRWYLYIENDVLVNSGLKKRFLEALRVEREGLWTYRIPIDNTNPMRDLLKKIL